MMREDDKISYGGNRRLIKNLDRLPFPDYSGYLENKMNDEKFRYPIVTSRGCPFNCAFCENRTLWGKHRFRSAENVLKEMKYANEKYGVDDFLFADSLINGNIKELGKLCDLIIESGLKIKWQGLCSFRKEMSMKLLKKMYDSGCHLLFYGLESGSQKVLNEMNKKTHVKNIEKILRYTHEAGIATRVAFVIGFPTETTLDFIKSVLLFIKLRSAINVAAIYSCAINPASDLYLNPNKYGIDAKTLYNEKEYMNDILSVASWKTKDGRNTSAIRGMRHFVFSICIALFLIETYPNISSQIRYYINKHLIKNEADYGA